MSPLKENVWTCIALTQVGKVSSTEDIIMITTRGEREKVVPGVEGFHLISVKEEMKVKGRVSFDV